MTRVLATALLAVSFAPVLAEEAPDADRYAKAPLRDRIFFGGGIGLGFGDVDYVAISPVVGIRVTERLNTGLGLLYQHRKDSRFTPALKTDDYGASMFARYTVARPFFLSAEIEYLSYEFQDIGLSNDRTSVTSLLAGGGFYQPLGRYAAGFVSVLYNFSYDENELFDPYDSPWVYRAGVEFGF